MPSILTRRSLLRGLFAAPAVVCAANLMPISARNLFDRNALLPGLFGLSPLEDAAIEAYLREQVALGYVITRKAIEENLYSGNIIQWKPVELINLDLWERA